MSVPMRIGRKLFFWQWPREGMRWFAWAWMPFGSRWLIWRCGPINYHIEIILPGK